MIESDVDDCEILGQRMPALGQFVPVAVTICAGWPIISTGATAVIQFGDSCHYGRPNGSSS